MWPWILLGIVVLVIWISVYKVHAKQGRRVLGFVGGLSLGVLTALGVAIFMAQVLGMKAQVGSGDIASENRGPRLTNFMEAKAENLYKDYDANEVAADEKYKGKLIAVTGTIQSINKDAFGNVVVRLNTSNQFMGVVAVIISTDERSAARLEKHKIVWLYCEGSGRVVGSPTLKNCHINSPS